MKIIKNSIVLSLVSLAICCNTDDDYSVSTSPEMAMDTMSDITQELTTIPDAGFENYLISIGVDTTLDGSVITSNLATVEEIVINNLDISDLTGIEDCPNLFNLWLQNCNVSQLDVSNNLELQFIYFDNNNVQTIDVSMLPLLEKLSGRNNGLNSIDVSNNPELELLEISDNDLTNLDVSTNTVLNRLDVVNNPLDCITVNNDQLSSTTQDWTLDDEDTLSLNCN